MEIFDIGTFGTSLSANTVSYVGGFWQEGLERSLAPGKQSRIRVYPVGFGGVTSTYGLNTGLPKLLQYRPRLVTIEFLMNDCATSNDISPATSEQNHRDIISAIQAALPETAIYLMTMNPPIDGAVAARPEIEMYNDIYRGLAAEIFGLGLIDIAPDWVGATDVEIPDGIHPTLAAQLAITVPAIVASIASEID